MEQNGNDASNVKVRIKLLDFLKQSGLVTTSAKGKRLIRDEIILVNGVRSKNASQLVIPSQVTINFQTRTQDIVHAVPILIVYHKPCGMVCTTSDTVNITSNLSQVYNANDPIPSQFKPIGRLDQHSHGLLLFSSDGRLTSSLLSPRTSVERTYEIIVQGDVGRPDSAYYNSIIEKVEKGVQTDFGFYQGMIHKMQRNVPNIYVHQRCGSNCGGERSDVQSERIFGTNIGPSILSSISVTVNEGKKRMVRRLFAALGLFIVDLKRTSYGMCGLGDLESGKWRYASESEHNYAIQTIENWELRGSGWSKNCIKLVQ
jgi:23S rRNA pseudouridine2605 synthase